MKQNQGITIVGLGPGDPESITRKAWKKLTASKEVYLRTRHHPAVDGFPTDVEVHSFDDYYNRYGSHDEIYEAIIEKVVDLGKRDGGVVYAVPGHPFVAESTSIEIFRRAKKEGIQIEVIEGISFIDSTLRALKFDPLPNLIILDGLDLLSDYHPQFSPNYPALIAQIHSQEIAGMIKLILMEVYGDEHQVHLVHSAGSQSELVENCPLFAIDRSQSIGNLTTLFVPPLEIDASLESFQNIVAHLRSPEGCPWDISQTRRSLRANMLEECYEVLTAIDQNDPTALKEELGDLLLHIVLQAQIASEEGEFILAEVIDNIHKKIVKRHPHVFDDLKLNGIDEVMESWENIKLKEREHHYREKQGILDGVPITLPALNQAHAYQERAARVGFDWPEIQGVLDKIDEEVREILNSETDDQKSEEMGDLIFSIVNLARRLNIDAESALRSANAKFYDRFKRMQEMIDEQDKATAELSLNDWEDYWEESKKMDKPPGDLQI